MDTATEKVTPRQRALLSKLMLSSTFSAEEAHRTAVWLVSPGATKERATRSDRRCFVAHRKARNDAQKDSPPNRKAEFHASKENGNGEYSPRRYSNENPPTNGKPVNRPTAPPEDPASSCTSSRSRTRAENLSDQWRGLPPTKTKPPPLQAKAIFG